MIREKQLFKIFKNPAAAYRTSCPKAAKTASCCFHGFLKIFQRLFLANHLSVTSTAFRKSFTTFKNRQIIQKFEN